MIFEMPSEKWKCVSVFNKKSYAKTICLTHTWVIGQQTFKSFTISSNCSLFKLCLTEYASFNIKCSLYVMEASSYIKKLFLGSHGLFSLSGSSLSDCSFDEKPIYCCSSSSSTGKSLDKIWMRVWIFCRCDLTSKHFCWHKNPSSTSP